MPDIAQFTLGRSVLVPIGFDFRVLADMAGCKTTGGFKTLDAVIDRPEHGKLVFVGGVVIAAFVVRVH